MSVPPYVPPTEEEFTDLHRRLSSALDRLRDIASAVGIKDDQCFHGDVVQAVKNAQERLRCLDIAVGVTLRA